MNLMIVASIIGFVVLVWTSTLITFDRVGWMASTFSTPWQGLMVIVSVAITGVLCALA